MALRGTLKDFGLADIFQLIGIQRKTGVLILTHGEHRVLVSFLAGNVVSADSSERALEDRLGAVLVKSGKITSRQLSEALKVQKQTLQRLGTILVEQGAIGSTDLQEALRVQVTQIIHHLFRWRDGAYDFSQEETIDYDREHFAPIPAESILMEGARMIDEWPILERRIRSFDLVLRRKSTGHPPSADPVSVYETDIDFELTQGQDGAADAAAPRLDEAENLVYGLVDGRSTIQDIIDRSHLGDFETSRILYELLTRDLIEEGLAGDARPEAPAARTTASWLLRGALLLMPAVAAVSLLTALRSPFSPLGHGSRDPFGIDRIRTHLSQAKVGRIDQAVHIYLLQKQLVPGSIEDLVGEGFLRADDLQDPWGRPYRFETDAGGYTITGYDAAGLPDKTVSLQSEFAAAQRLALEGGSPASLQRR
jgi:hypothetical protein